MLRLLRQNASSWIIKILLGVIVLVFVLWGTGSYQDKKSNQIASVNGHPISMDTYRETYNNLVETYRQKFGTNFNDELIKMLDLKKQAMDKLINQNLFLQEAKKLCLKVSTEELAASIRSIKAFQTEGIFDNRQYSRVLQYTRMAPEKFEGLQKDMILLQKLDAIISGSVKISEPEALEWFNWNNASVNIDAVLFNPDTYSDIETTDEEIKTYFEKHRENYKTEPNVKVRYLRLSFEDYKKNITLSDDESKEYYNSNTEEFTSQKTVEASHILFKVEQNASPESVEETKKKALDVLKKAKEGKDFAELAKEYSEGPSKDKGGKLGAFTKESMVKPFSDKAFSIKPGEIGDPIRTRFGWHIIKVEKVNEQKTQTYDEAKDKIIANLTNEKAKILAYDEAESIYEISLEDENLVRSAETRGLKTATTDFFSKKTPYKEVQDRVKFSTTAFNLMEGEVSDVQDFGDGYYILQAIKKVPEKLSELSDVKNMVSLDLTQEKLNAKAAENAKSFLESIKTGGSMDTESTKVISTGFFKRTDSIPGIGYDQELAISAFKLSENKKIPDDIVKGKKGYYVIQFKEKIKPSLEEFKKEKSKILEDLLNKKKMNTLTTWIAQLKEKSEITIDNSILE